MTTDPKSDHPSNPTDPTDPKNEPQMEATSANKSSDPETGAALLNNPSDLTASEKEKSAETGQFWLTGAIFLGVVLAILITAILPESWLSNLQFLFILGGKIFLDLLQMLIVPLVMASVMSGVINLGDVRKLGVPGGLTLLYFLSTTFMAVVLGLVVVNLIRPGLSVDKARIEQAEAKGQIKAKELEDKARAQVAGVMPATKTKPETISKEEGKTEEKVDKPSFNVILINMVLMLFTDNLLSAMVERNLLPLIVFSILFAGALTTIGDKVKPLTDMILAVNESLLKFVIYLMYLAPIGIFCLVASRFVEAKLDKNFNDQLAQIFWYMMTVLIGLGIHAIIILPLVTILFSRRNPFVFLYQMAQALITAFSTASSSSTIPVTMECAEVNGKVPRQSCDFVIPLGATINMNGTALYEACAALFIAQTLTDFDLSLQNQFIIAVTSTLAAIGAAGIPEAGLVTMVLVLNAVGLPIARVDLILAVDWLLDRFRTAVNVWGDAVGAALMAPWFEQK